MNTQTDLPPAQHRPIYEIAAEIQREWKKVNFAAAPYLSAMHSLRDAGSTYGCDSAQSIVLYFLGNAQGWRGEAAKRIKQELKQIIGVK